MLQYGSSIDDANQPHAPAHHRRSTRVSDGTRTRDSRHHKPGLYQLSYAHHAREWEFHPLRVPTSLTDRRGVDARPGRAPVAGPRTASSRP